MASPKSTSRISDSSEAVSENRSLAVMPGAIPGTKNDVTEGDFSLQEVEPRASDPVIAHEPRVAQGRAGPSRFRVSW